MKKKNIRNRLILVLLSLLLTVVCLEVAGRIYSHIRYGADHIQLKITEREQYLSPISVDRMNAGRAWENTLELHPLFGYVLSTNLAGVNNYGFRCEYDFEINPEGGYMLSPKVEGETVTVGVFGGSFAYVTARQARWHIKEWLRETFPGKTPVVLNFAQGGYALPQTFATFTYFQSLVDIAVFIDGLNEPWNYYLNNLSGNPPEFAKAFHWNYKLSLNQLTPFMLESTVALLDKRAQVKRATAISLSPVIRQSVLAYYAWVVVCRRAENFAKRTTRAMEESFTESGNKFAEVDDRDLFQFSISQWRDYHDLVHELSRRAGITDVHVLQPNPYAPGRKKVLTEREKKITANDGGTKYIVTNAYPLLEVAMGSLSSNGVACLDLSDVYYSETNTIWNDYCHAGDRGGIIVMDHVLGLLAERKSTTP